MKQLNSDDDDDDDPYVMKVGLNLSATEVWMIKNDKTQYFPPCQKYILDIKMLSCNRCFY